MFVVLLVPIPVFPPIGGAEQSMLRSAAVASHGRPPPPARAASVPWVLALLHHRTPRTRPGTAGLARQQRSRSCTASAEQLQRTTKRTRSHVPRPRRPVPRTDSARRPRPAWTPQRPYSELRHALHTTRTRPPETTPLTHAANAAAVARSRAHLSQFQAGVNSRWWRNLLAPAPCEKVT